MEHNRYVVFHFDAQSNLDVDTVKEYPQSEAYFVDLSNIQVDPYNEIDMKLLNDLHRPVKLVFVGGHLAKEAAETYWATWIEDTPAVNEEVIQFWSTPTNEGELNSGSDLIMIRLWEPAAPEAVAAMDADAKPRPGKVIIGHPKIDWGGGCP